MTTKTSNKVKSHIRYKDQEGNIVPGVTTILGILNKPALVTWANKLGLQGIDSTKYRDEMADIGTLAHLMILDYFNKQETDTSEYSKSQIEKAENCMLSFFEWDRKYDIEPILIEKPLVSEVWKYGGTVDLYCKLDGELTLIDFKTGKAIYSEAIMQVATYSHLLAENGYTVKGVKILRIGRDENEGFDEKTLIDCETGWQIFLRCLDIYNLKKVLKS